MKVGAGHLKKVQPVPISLKPNGSPWGPFSVFGSTVNNLFPLYFNELAYFGQFCFLGPHSAGGGPHFTKNWVPILTIFGPHRIWLQCTIYCRYMSKRLLKAGHNTLLIYFTGFTGWFRLKQWNYRSLKEYNEEYPPLLFAQVSLLSTLEVLLPVHCSWYHNRCFCKGGLQSSPKYLHVIFHKSLQI